MKLALIGYGGMGSYHAANISEMNQKGDLSLTLSGIWDIDPARREAARAAGFATFESLEEALSSCEAVLLATPNDTHLPLTQAAAAAGKHILCEKPIACSLEEAEQMYRAAEEGGVLLTVHQNRRLDPDFLCLKQIVEGGELGRIYRIESQVCGGNGIPGDWRKRAAQGGGMMLDWGVHLLDQMHLLFGRPDWVHCVCSFVLGEEVDDGFLLEAGYPGLLYRVEVDTNCFVPRFRWLAFGEAGTAEISDWEMNGEMVRVKERVDPALKGVQAGNGLTKTMAARSEQTLEKLPLPKASLPGPAYYRNFAAAAAGKEAPFVKKEEVLSVFSLMEEALRSDRERRVISLKK